MSNRTCLHCQRDFETPGPGNHRYCCAGCRVAAACGTVKGYAYGCRCGDCRSATAKAMRGYYAKRKAEGRPMGRGRKRNKNFSGVCEQCGSGFQAEAGQRFCSRACFGASTRRVRSTELVHVGPVIPKDAPPTPVTVVTLPKWWAVLTAGPCAWCGDHFIGVGTQAAYCSKKCGRESMHAKRGGRFVIEPRVRREIYERDDWTCQLCNEPVDLDADPWSDWYPSLDHIVPQSHMLIPDHSPSNLRTAHRWCNAIRGDGAWHADFFEEASCPTSRPSPPVTTSRP